MKLAWQWKEIRTTDSIQGVLCGDDDEWKRLGDAGCSRLTTVWCTGGSHDFFLTLRTCVAFKYTLGQMLDNGMILKRASGDYGGQDLLAVRFGDGLSTPNQKILNIGLYDRDFDFPAHIPITVHAYTLSGQKMIDEKMPRFASTWWEIAKKIFEQHGEMNAKFIIDGEIVPRHMWHKSLLEPVVPNEEVQIMPQYTKSKLGGKIAGTPSMSSRHMPMPMKVASKPKARPKATPKSQPKKASKKSSKNRKKASKKSSKTMKKASKKSSKTMKKDSPNATSKRQVNKGKIKMASQKTVVNIKKKPSANHDTMSMA